jgi:hypothetical protein
VCCFEQFSFPTGNPTCDYVVDGSLGGTTWITSMIFFEHFRMKTRPASSRHGDFRIHHKTFPMIRQFLSRPIEIGL